MILYANVIQSIGEQLKLRQQVIATATGKYYVIWHPTYKLSQCHSIKLHPNYSVDDTYIRLWWLSVFFRRFYIRNYLSSCDPLLMAPTCLFLAAKVEEHGAISQNRLINAATQIVRNKYRDVFRTLNDYPYRGTYV